MKNVFYCFYVFIIFSIIYFITGAPKFSFIKPATPPQITGGDTIAGDEEKNTNGSGKKIQALANPETCMNDNYTIADGITQFKRKVCIWGDGDSSVYPANAVSLSHRYTSYGKKRIILKCDAYIPFETSINVCKKPEPLDFGILPNNSSNFISNDTLPFGRRISLHFIGTEDASHWIINKKLYKSDVNITFSQPGPVNVTFRPASQAGSECYCDTSFVLVLVRK